MLGLLVGQSRTGWAGARAHHTAVSVHGRLAEVLLRVSVGAVGGIDGRELAILEHGLEDSSIHKLGLLDQTRQHVLARLPHLSFNKRHHGDVALEFDVLTEVQAIFGGAELFEANLDLLWGLAGLVALDAVLVAHVNVHGSINVRLQAPGHIVEASIELNLARAQLTSARDVLNALGDLIPAGIVFIGGGVARCRDGLVLEDEGVDVDNFAVRVEEIDGELARDVARDGRDNGQGFPFAKHLGGVAVVSFGLAGMVFVCVSRWCWGSFILARGGRSARLFHWLTEIGRAHV